MLFDSEESDREIEFGAALYKEFALRMSENMNVMEAYNSQEELRDVKGYRESGMADAAVVDPEEPAKATDWQFRPMIRPYGNAAVDFRLCHSFPVVYLCGSHLFCGCGNYGLYQKPECGNPQCSGV